MGRKLFRVGLRLRLLLLVSLALLPFLFVTGSGIVNRYEFRVDRELEASQEFAEAIAVALLNYLETVWSMELAVGVAVAEGHNAGADAEAILLAEKEAHPSVEHISWLDPEGRVLFSTYAGAQGAVFADQEHFRRVMNGAERSISPVLISRITGRPSLSVVRGIRRQGALVGMVAANLDLSAIGRHLPVQRAGNSGFGLLDHQGQLVYRNLTPDLTMAERKLPDDAPFLPALQGEITVHRHMVSPVTGEARMGVAVPIDALGWAVFATAPVDQVMAGIRARTYREITVTVGATLLSLLAVAAVAGWVLRPVLAMQRAALAISRGDMSARTGIYGQDEVAATAQTFDAMVEQVQADQIGLETQAAQQAAVALLGQRALAGAEPPTLLREAVQLVHEVLGPEAAAVWEEQGAGRPLRLMAVNGGLEGYIAEYAGGTRTFTAQEAHFLQAMAHIVSSSLERHRQEQVAAVQHAVTRILAAAESVDQAAVAVLEAVCQGLGWEAGGLCLGVPAGAGPHCTVFWPQAERELPAARHLATQVRELNAPVWQSEGLDQRFPCGMGFPVGVGSRTLGVLVCLSVESRPPDQRVLQALADIGSQVGLFQERKQDETEILLLNAELERRVAQRTAELKAANAELEAFCYSVSHDLRAPLRTIAGFARALEEDCGHLLDADSTDALNRIRGGAARMEQLIQDLLRLSRITRSEMRRERVDLSALARMVGAELAKVHPGRHLEFRVEAGLGAYGDERLLRVVLENLLGNAWKFTAGVAGATVTFEGAGDSTFVVRDNGAGFDQRYRDKLFQPFQRLHRATEFEGSGIGLATVRRVIHRHGGRVWAEGAVDAGAAFYFTLP